MKLYKSPSNQVFAYESDGSQDAYIPADYVPITQAEADVLIKQNEEAAWDALPDDQKKLVCKAEASGLLSQTDWTTIPDVADPAYPPYLANQTEFIAWRSQIRQYAVNPQTSWTFPPQPIEVWNES